MIHMLRQYGLELKGLGVVVVSHTEFQFLSFGSLLANKYV
jgi:hypothetical protein